MEPLCDGGVAGTVQRDGRHDSLSVGSSREEGTDDALERGSD